MVDFDYLFKGLCGMARAHRANTMSGHLGAAVVAGYFCGEELPDLDEKVYRGIEGELNRILHGEEAFWYNQKKTGITIAEMFDSFPKQQPDKEKISSIANALSGNIDKTRQSGHNVIFAAIAVRALNDHPQYATPSIVEGICKLIKGFDGEVPGRGYFGKERGWIIGDKVSLPDDKDFPPYKNETEMAEAVIDELIHSAAIRRQGFGGLWHVINHAAALVELSRFGFQKLAKKGLAAHHHHVRLWRSLPDVEQERGAVEKAGHDPRVPEFWKDMLKRDSARLTHRIKTLYGFFILIRLIENPAKRKKAEDSLLYLMA